MRKVALIVTGDGNNSLSRMPHRNQVESRVFESDYFLPQSATDEFDGQSKFSKGKRKIMPPEVSLYVISRQSLLICATIGRR
jgi:hypothetical protein